jgi:hypothetical protein
VRGHNHHLIEHYWNSSPQPYDAMMDFGRCGSLRDVRRSGAVSVPER